MALGLLIIPLGYVDEVEVVVAVVGCLAIPPISLHYDVA